MLYCGNSYSSMNTEREAPYNPYGNTDYYQRQPTAPGMAPGGALPTGIPSGPPYGGTTLPTQMPTAIPTTPSAAQAPQTVQSPYYTAGYLRRFIGRDVRVEFLIGNRKNLLSTESVHF